MFFYWQKVLISYVQIFNNYYQRRNIVGYDQLKFVKFFVTIKTSKFHRSPQAGHQVWHFACFHFILFNYFFLWIMISWVTGLFVTWTSILLVNLFFHCTFIIISARLFGNHYSLTWYESKLSWLLILNP